MGGSNDVVRRRTGGYFDGIYPEVDVRTHVRTHSRIDTRTGLPIVVAISLTKRS